MGKRFEPAKGISGKLVPPPDKSISHRAILIGSLCEGPVQVSGLLDAADIQSSLDAVRSLGVKAEDGSIGGVGLRGVREPGSAIDVGNAGTLMRLLPGWLAGQAGKSFTLDGDESIRCRPVDRVAEPLKEMGAGVEAREGRYPPLTIIGSELKAISYRLPIASAQVKSCVLLAGLLAEGRTVIEEPAPSRDHTERMLARAGAPVSVEGKGSDGRLLTISAPESLTLGRVDIPGDFSSAAFALTAALLIPGSELVVEGVGVNWTRTGLLRVLERMGAGIEGRVEVAGSASETEEPESTLTVRGSRLAGTTVTAEEVPLLIDELPLVALLGAFAEGETVVTGAEELRHKESDRIATVVDGLGALGARIEATEDGFTVQGTGGLRGGTIDSAGDHRLAMLGAIAGLVSREGVEVEGIESVAISYPDFLADLEGLIQPSRSNSGRAVL